MTTAISVSERQREKLRGMLLGFLIGIAFAMLCVAVYFTTRPGTPQEPIKNDQEPPKTQLIRITEGTDENGKPVRVSEFGLPECERCRKLFEEPEG